MPLLVTYNNGNIIIFTNKTISFEGFVEIHKVLLDKISDNIASLVNTGRYGVISTTYIETMGYYVVKFLSHIVTLHYNNTTYEKVFKAGELAVTPEFLRSMKYTTNWFCDTEKNEQILIFPHSQ